MARVNVLSAVVADGRIQSLEVQLGKLPKRKIDRDTAIAWMRDQHSLIPLRGGVAGRALQLLAIDNDDETAWFIRDDHELNASDELRL